VKGHNNYVTTLEKEIYKQQEKITEIVLLLKEKHSYLFR